MANVAYDVEGKYPKQPANVVWGEAKNPATNLCLDSMGNAIPGTPGISHCHGYGGNQVGKTSLFVVSTMQHLNVQAFRINTQGQMSFGEWCVTIWSDRLKSDRCEFGHADGPWQYDKVRLSFNAVPRNAYRNFLTDCENYSAP